MYESFDPVPELTQFPGTFRISDGDFPIIQNLGSVVLGLFISWSKTEPIMRDYVTTVKFKINGEKEK